MHNLIFRLAGLNLRSLLLVRGVCVCSFFAAVFFYVYFNDLTLNKFGVFVVLSAALASAVSFSMVYKIKGRLSPETCLIVVVSDAVWCALIFYFFPDQYSILFGFLGLNLLFSSFILPMSLGFFLLSASVLISVVLFVSHPFNWLFYDRPQFLINAISFAFYFLLARAFKDFYLENEQQIKDLSKRLFRQSGLNDFILTSLPVGVFLKRPNMAVAPENPYGAKILVRNREFFKGVFEKTESQAEYEDANLDRFYSVKRQTLNLESHGASEIILVSDETEKRKKDLELEQSRKLSAIGTLSAGLAHEIRNPLAGIRGIAELLQQGMVEDAGKKNQLFKRILNEVDRLNGLLTDFLNFAKPDAFSFREVEIRDLMDDLKNLISLDARAQEIAFEFNIKSQILNLDSDKVKQVFLNLFINAAQAFNLERVNKIKAEGGQPLVRVLGEPTSTGYQIKVQDNGVGIKKSQLNKIFEPFHTTKDKGTGLGLALSHRILKEHGADVFVSSDLGQGTCFEIVFKK